MEFLTPAGPNPLDRQKVLGKGYDRIDGPLKVAGKATYAFEYHDVAPNAAYGFLLTAGIGKGVIRTIDTGDAERAPGVLLVMTHLHAPKQATVEHGAPQLQGPEINQAGQAVAFVVAESFEQARAAAEMIHIDYRQDKGSFSLAAMPALGIPHPREKDVDVGDFAGAFAAAPVKVDATYSTP